MTRDAASSLRIGCVKYLNAKPLIHGWPGEVLFDHPTVLCSKLAAGELDVACVSSFEYLRNPVYAVVDGVSVASRGPVHSVIVANTEPLSDISEIALDPASATSVNLLRCLLAERGLQPELVTRAADSGSARLLIGDQAIAFRAAHGGDYKFWDLAEAWRELTDLPFVFALWLIRPEVTEATDIAHRLRTLRDENLRSLNSVISAQLNFGSAFCEFYFRECLCFGLADAEKAGLLRFRSLCEKHGILPANPTPLRLV
ncbi:MAG: menaquinone biosynthetic enzyme MqnA/MqnD family protein [Chthoniobacterales bacterium]